MNRGDIGALAGPRLANCGFALAGDGIAPGGYTIVAYAHSAYPSAGGNPIFLGTVTPATPRAYLEAMFGLRFRNAGFSLSANLASGSYQLVACALSAATGQFDNVRVRPMIVP